MKYQDLGNTGLKLSEIAFGAECMWKGHLKKLMR